MIDYMATPKEMAKQPAAWEWCCQIAKGDVAVFNALWSFWNFAHAWDDLIDEAQWPADRKEQAWKALHDFTVDLLVNPFIRQHAAELRGSFVSAIARNLDGDAFAKSDDPALRAASSALRCSDVDVILHMAYLHGGWDALRKWGGKRRFDPPEEKGPSDVR